MSTLRKLVTREKTPELKKLKRRYNNSKSKSSADRFEDSQISISRVCIEALQDGCVDAFSHVFHLSHRAPVLVDPIAEKYFKISTPKLREIKQSLVKAEEMRRQSGQVSQVYDVYYELACYFEQNGDIKTSMYFHRKGQEVARQSSDALLEGRAHSNHGKLFERLGDVSTAASHYERHLALAEKGDDVTYLKEASKEVVRIYSKIADEHLKTENLKSAREILEKSYGIARKCNDTQLIAETAYRCGCVLTELKDVNSALEYHQIHYDLCSNLMDDSEKAKAMSRLGSLYEQAGMQERSLGLLKDLLMLSQKRAKQSPSQESTRMIGESLEKLGTLLMEMNKHEEAISHFEHNFQLANESGDEKWTVAARIRLGFARGEHALRSNNMENLHTLTNIK